MDKIAPWIGIANGVYLNHGPRPLLEAETLYIEWRSELIAASEWKCGESMSQFVANSNGHYEDGVFVPSSLHQIWPWPKHGQINEMTPKYEMDMIQCAQKMFCDITLKVCR